MKTFTNRRVKRAALAVLALLALGVWASAVHAEVRREGKWPKADKAVTLSVNGLSRSEAIKRLADKAGWSVVVQTPSGAPVDLHVKQQDAGKVLELLLADGRYVARRDGSLVSIAPDPNPPGAAESAQPAAADDAEAPGDAPGQAQADPDDAAEPTVARPAATASADAEDDEPAERGDDRVVTGGSTTVGKDEIVHDVVVLGGSAEVLGHVTGDVAVMGGDATIRSGARVRGDATALGGTLTIEDGARVDGDVGVLGGDLRRGDDARIDGKVTSGEGVHLRWDDDDEDDEAWSFASLAEDAGSALTRMALLFVFGAVLLGVATRRMEKLQTEVAARPARAFGYGVVGVLASLVLFIALCIIVIGIPVAIVGLMLGIFATYAGICAVLAAVGAALVQHKSQNPYVHLAVGCAVYLVAGSLPFVGGLITFVLVMVGIGVMVITRAAGLVPPRKRNATAGPYRTPAEAA